MFELEEYAGGFHDGFLNKYADSSGPTLDFYISDSLQDMLDIDIRSEVANVVGSANDYESCLGGLPSSLEHATDSLSLLNSNCSSNAGRDSGSIGCSWNTSSAFGLGSSNSSSSWFGANNDFLADVGACVNPISVMPLISSSLIHMSPKTNLNANILRSNSPPPPSPNVNDTKSHLTFSPAHIKISAHSIRNEQITSHIPKQIVAISSAVTSGTTVPATLATNSAQQRKNAAVDAIRKDLGADLRKVVPISTTGDNILFKTSTATSTSSQCSISNTTSAKTTITTFAGNGSSVHQGHNNSSSINNNINSLNGGSISSSTIKLGPGIGGLTFANNITYNKMKQQSHMKTSSASASTSATISSNGTIVLKRDRESSTMQNNLSNNASNSQHVTKILSRNSIQSSSSFTPKSIASSAHHTSYALHQHNMVNGTSSLTNNANNSSGNHSTSLANNSANSSVSVFSASGLSSISSNSSSGNTNTNIIAVKPLQQKIKATVVESEFPKPAYSYSCLIAMALKNSRRGSLPVSEIYSFMCEHFPYFKTAPSGWKNSVRHNLSLNKCFEKIEKPPTNGNQRKGCLWAMNPERITKMDEEVQKWSRKDPMAIRNAMVCPDNLEALERGEMKHGSSGDSDTEMDSQSEIEEASDMEEQELDETLVDNLLVEEDVDDDMINGQSPHLHDHNDDNDSCEGLDRKNLHTTINSPLTIPTKTTTSNNPATCITTNIHRDFDIEVEDIYDAIDIDDDKEAVRMAISQSDIIELSPADYNISGDSSHQSPKRARLNVNYSIGPAGEIEKHFQTHNHQQQQQLHIQSIKKIVKVQNVHDLQQIQQQLQQQHQQIVVQTISTNSGSSQQTLQQQGSAQFTHLGRKMQLVNRIS
ncbi:probable serine/threonine-protein kinase dyrk2 [Calliphora vicina]|uniref:probable serine/threonine-protein kinase dyrk2 n=1 Tax=Calliphora vicina TaxID=7373 RepID=UPI00325C2F0A